MLKYILGIWGGEMELYLLVSTSCSVTKSCLTLCDPMDCSTPGFPVHHQLPELTQTHVYRVGDAIKPSHPLFSPSPHASLFPSIKFFPNELVLCISWPSIGQSIEVQLQRQSFQLIIRVGFLND